MSRTPFTLAVTAVLAWAAAHAPAAQASIVSNPAMLVNHGSYVTDTANQLDWYKFSNAVSSVGLSYTAALAQFTPLGWSVAGLGQVRSLQAQFGWTTDTYDFGNENLGLTQAMAQWLGLTGTTSTSPTSTPASYDRHDHINAMTAEAGCFSPLDCGQNTSWSHVRTVFNSTAPANQLTVFGDEVIGDNGYQAADATDTMTGTWLVRRSADATCTPGGPAPCGSTVPEPGSLALACIAMAGLISLRLRARRRLRQTA